MTSLVDGLPRDLAKLEVQRTDDPLRLTCCEGSVVRAVVHLHPNRRAAWAFGLDEEGRWHGLEREWDASGRLFYRARYVHGLQHGWQEQWDERGKALVRTRFVRGTGLDLWFSGGGWEERHMVDGLRDGLERLWVGRRQVFYEQHFRAGLEHGIERRWSDGGGLARGYPRYFVSGERVNRRGYLAACESDPSLPRYEARHDRPGRRWPRRGRTAQIDVVSSIFHPASRSRAS